MRKKIYFLTSMIAALSWEEGGLLIETDISNSDVSIIAPQEGAEIASSDVLFDWESVEEATQYEIQVATPDFNNTEQLLLNVTDSLTSAQLQLTVGDYQWRVRAKNSNYQTSYTTTSFKVIPVENFSNQVVTLLSPENNLVTNMADQTLLWETVDGASLYRIQVLESNVVTQESTTTSNSLDITFSETTSIWQVRGENGIENTLYSMRELLVDLTDPNTPVLSAPGDGITLTSGEVTFEWTRDPVAGSMELDSLYLYRDAGLTDLVMKDSVVSPFTTSLTNDTYFWRMQAFDTAGNQSNTSSVFTFTVDQ